MADGTVKEYRYPRHGNVTPPSSRWAADSLTAMLEAYRRSPEWAARAPLTNKLASACLRPLYEIGDDKPGEVTRRMLLEIRDAIASSRGHGAANNFVKFSASAFSWGRERGWIDHSPLDRVKRIKGGTFPAWSEADVSAAMAAFPEPLRRLVVLALYTGQRRSDLIALRWAQIAGNTIRLTQQKTRTSLAIPIHPDLAHALEQWRLDARTVAAGVGKPPTPAGRILQTAAGMDWTAQGLTQSVRRHMDKLGMARLNVHGLRKLAAARLAEAGCSANEIAAITGHRTLAEVERYTRSADQGRLAVAAIGRLKTPSDKRG